MHIDVVTIFPEMFPGVLGASMLKRAQEAGLLRCAVHDLRDYSRDKHRKVDGRPYGGGPGMIMQPEPMFEAVDAIKRGCAAHSPSLRAASRAQSRDRSHRGCRTILLSPKGEPLSPALSERLARLPHLILLCGHYEGVDERVRIGLADEAVSIGDYVLTGGELPALVLIDSVCRFIPGVLGHARATDEESFQAGWLEYPQYTRPPVFRGMAVPDVLLSGDHERIAQWRKLQSVAQTMASRPDLAQNAEGRSPKAERAASGFRPPA
jgi:tRNA (guanine37-N1)-methyltransferase